MFGALLQFLRIMNQGHCLESLQQNEAIKHKVRQTFEHICKEYNQQIVILEKSVKETQEKNISLMLQLQIKEKRINELTTQNQSLNSQLAKIQGELTLLHSENESLILNQSLQIGQHQSTIRQLKQSLQAKQSEIYRLKNIDMMSFDQSSVSMKDYTQHSFSLQISEVFRNSPQQMLKFLQSIQGEKPLDEKQWGNMTCMFVSKDGLSLQKYENVNRSFLKRTIKEHEKRFRFVLIYKPDKNAAS